jgi:hypothetical protein
VKTIIRLAVVLFASFGIAISQAHLALADSPPFYVDWSVYQGLGQWCIQENGTTVDSTIEIENCDSAIQAQWWEPYKSTNYPGLYDLKFIESGKCLTYPQAKDKPIGSYAVLGNCIDAATQVFYPFQDAAQSVGEVDTVSWSDVEIEMEDGDSVTVDLKNGSETPGNLIDGSYMSFVGIVNQVYSEGWYGPDCDWTNGSGQCGNNGDGFGV